MKNLVYIANARIPTEKAHGIAIMKMCEAFSEKGIETELVVPRRINTIKDNSFSYYGIKENFKIHKILVLDLMPWFGRLGFFIEALTFALGAALYCLPQKGIIYGRDEISLALLAFFGKSVVWESHTAKHGMLVKSLINRARAIVVISNGLRSHYVSLGASWDKILVAPSGVDIEDFSINISKDEARQATGLPLGKKIALYAGHLYQWKGVDILEEAKKLLPESIELVIISGKKYSEVPKFLKAADVLVLANTAKEDISKLHTSPLKLFEYMASERPIVAPDIPSMREILDDSTATLFEADNPQSLAQAISSNVSSREGAEEKAKNALKKVGEYTWNKRAETIFRLIYRL